MLILRNKGFHEFLLTILPQPLFNSLKDLSYYAFVCKLFISNDSIILRSCMLDSFASVFESSQLNHSWQSLECSPDASHFPNMLSSWCSIDRVSTHFFVPPMYSPLPPPPTPPNHNLIRKHRDNCLVIVYFCYCIVYFSVLQLMKRWPYIMFF